MIKLEKETGLASLLPHIEEWRNELSILFDKVLDEVKTLNSLKSSEIGFARSNTLLKVFKFILTTHKT